MPLSTLHSKLHILFGSSWITLRWTIIAILLPSIMSFMTNFSLLERETNSSSFSPSVLLELLSTCPGRNLLCFLHQLQYTVIHVCSTLAYSICANDEPDIWYATMHPNVLSTLDHIATSSFCLLRYLLNWKLFREMTSSFLRDHTKPTISKNFWRKITCVTFYLSCHLPQLQAVFPVKPFVHKHAKRLVRL